MPFEAKGVLIDEGDSLRIKGHWLKEKSAFESRFQKSQCRVEWLGNRSIKAGNLHWAKLITERGTLLFSADTGINAQASREALADIFRSAFPEFALNSEQTSDFALEKNRRSLTLLLIMSWLRSWRHIQPVLCIFVAGIDRRPASENSVLPIDIAVSTSC